MGPGPTDGTITGLGQQEAGGPAQRMREHINNGPGAQEAPQHCFLDTGVGSVTLSKLVPSLRYGVLILRDNNDTYIQAY